MGQQSDICLSFSVLGVSLVFPLWICLWTFHNSRSYYLTWGKTKKREREERKKIILLLTLNPLSEFCSSSRMPHEDGAWASLFSLPVVLQGQRPGLGQNILSCPTSGPGPPSAARPPLSICTWPVPLSHQLHRGPCSAPPPCSLAAHHGWSPPAGKQRQSAAGQVVPLNLWASTASQAPGGGSNQPWVSGASQPPGKQLNSAAGLAPSVRRQQVAGISLMVSGANQLPSNRQEPRAGTQRRSPLG